MSMPTSAIAATALRLTAPAGSDPPENTSTRSPARWRIQPAAIWERPALWTQRNSTAGRRAGRCSSGTVRVPPLSGRAPGGGEAHDAAEDLVHGGGERTGAAVGDRVGHRPMERGRVEGHADLPRTVAHRDDEAGLRDR